MVQLTLGEVSFGIKNEDMPHAAAEIYERHLLGFFQELNAEALTGIFSLEGILKVFKWSVICDRSSGDVVGLSFFGSPSNSANFKPMFEAMAPYVVPGSYIDFEMIDSNCLKNDNIKFTYSFKDKTLYDHKTPDRLGSLEGFYNTAGGCVEYKFYRKPNGKVTIQSWSWDCDKDEWVRSCFFPNKEFVNTADAMKWLAESGHV